MQEQPAPLIVLSTIPVFTRNLVWAAGHAGRPCWVVTDQPDGPWRAFPHVIGVDDVDREAVVRGDEGLLALIADRARECGARGVAAADTRTTRLLLAAGSALPDELVSFPMPGSDSFEQLYDKQRCAALLEELSLPTPESCAVHGADELDGIALPLPAIVKPSQGEGGDAVLRADTPDQVRELVESTPEHEKCALLVQRFVPGHDLDLSLLADRGRIVAWTAQTRVQGRVRFVERPDVLALGRELVARTDYHGVLHLDLRIDERDDSAWIIDANPRFWGSLCYSVWAGVNFLDLGLRMAEGEDVAAEFRPVTGDCPYLDITRRSLPRLLLGGWPVPCGLSAPQRRAWRFHHRWGSGIRRHWLSRWLRGPRASRGPRA